MTALSKYRLTLAAFLLFTGQAWCATADRYTVDSDNIEEASGVAVSRRNPDVLWTHNDSGNLPFIYAISTHGHYLGQVDVDNALSVDWEDIAAFELHGKPYLLIADTGDNFGFRPPVVLYLLPEPDIKNADKNFTAKAKVTRKIEIVYPDHGHDVEAVAVDAKAGKVYLLTKRDKTPILFEAPLAVPDDGEPVTVRRVAEIKALAAVTASEKAAETKSGKHRYWPSALDISADGRHWMISTATGGYLYTRKAGQTLEQMFANKPRHLSVPGLRQLEAGALSPDNRFAYFMSEKLPTALVALRLNQTE